MPVLAWLLLGVAIAAALPARGQDEVASARSAVFVGPSTSSAGASQAPSRLRGSGSGGARRIVLPPPAVDERRSSVPRSTDGGPVLPRIGFGRDLALLTGSAPSVDDLVWEDLAAGGRAASLTIVSPGARALRLQLEISKAPPGLEVRFYDPEEAAARIEPVPRSELIRNGGGAPATYWSPTVAGDGIAVELYLPAGTTANLEMIVRRISHLEENPRSLEDVGDAPCSADLDIACRVGAVSATTRSSVAKYTFTNVHGFASYCTGTLLNDLDATTQVPYFLTAEHCVGNQSEAASMELYWFFERAECGGRAPRTVTVQQGGAVMLSSESLSGGADYSFLRLNRDPPAGAGMSGWTSVPLSLEDAVVGVHHPAGDLKLVLEGVVEYNDRPDKVQILGTAGVSVGGSSGSGIWKRIGRKDYLVGVLSGGTKQCHETQHDLYGRMEHLYAQVSEWLGDGASVGGRPASSVTGLALVDASNGSTLMELREDGAVFDLDATDVRSFNIRAGLSAGVAPTAVAMELSGAPHTLYGEHGGSGLSPGAYTVSAAPTDASGEVLPSRSARFTVTGEAEASDIAVTELALTTPVGGPDLAVLSDRAAIDVRHGKGELLGLRAATGGTGRVGSVGFEVTGAAVLSLTADTAPFTVDVELPAGTYSIAATPYPEAGLQGMAGPPTTVAGVMLSYPASPIAGFTLVDAEGGPPDPDLQVIEAGSLLDLSAVPGVVNIRADVIADAPEIGSVRVELAGQKSARRLENRPAYALFGDEPGGDYRGELLPDGHYTVTATAYEGKEGGGDAYPGLAVRFTVTGAPLSDDAMLADDATLSALSLSDVDIGTFSSGTTGYSATAAHAVSATTVSATPSDDGATVTISDGSGSVERVTRTVALSEGANTIAVTVTAEDGVTERVYTVSVTRQAAPPDDVPAGFPVDAYPSGLWSDGEVVWVSDLNGSRLLAYDRVDGGRAQDRDIATPEMGAPAGLWSDGGTLWVADYEDGAVLAYRLSDGARQADRDIGLAAGNASPTGVWSDGDTLWVADYGQRRIYAYGFDGGRRESREPEIDDGVLRPWGLWSKGDVLWVAHWLGGELRAYRLSDGERLDGNDLDLESAGNAHPMGVYAEGGHVWTTDTTERKVYVHAFGDDDGGVGSPSSDASLSGLTLSGVDIGTFSPATTSYSATAAPAVSATTVTATPSDGSATVTISDGAGGVEGPTRTVALSEGANTITVTVTAADGATTETYTVTVARAWPLPIVSIAAVASPVSEGELAEFRVSRTGPTTGEMTVDVSVGFGNDSTADEYAIKLRAGKRSRVGITRLDDNNVVRDDVTVTWTLEESDRYTVSADANSAFVVLEENDAAEFALSVDPDAIAEGESATVEVAIANGVTFAAEQTIELDFGGSTATAAADYSVSSDSLALAAGARTARATVAAMRDSDTEGDETVSVAASHDGADIGTVSLKIEDAAYIPLTGWFEDVPESHDGSTAFRVTLRFSAPLSSGSAAKLRGGAVAVGDGTLSSARRVNGDRAVWTLKVTPSGTADVTLTLSAEVACDAGGVCTADGRRLSVQVGTTVPGPTASSPVLTGASVSGARLTLSYDDELDGGSTPSPPDFVVLSGSDAVPVRSVQVAGVTATLTLARPVPAGERVAASYLVAPMHPLRDAQGRAAAPFTATAVRNATPAGWVFAAAPAPVPATPAAGIPEAALSGSPSRLDLTSRQLSDIPVLAGLPLTELNLHGNALADLAPLSTLPGLRVLDLSGNRVTELWPLAGLTALERLDLSGNRIVDVSPLAELARLEVLLLDGNAVAEVLPLSPLTGLVHLGLSGNRIEDVGLLSELGALRRLDLSGNPVADVSPLGDLSRLVWLNLVGNPVDDLAPLGRLTRLRWLWLDAGAAGSGALAPLTEGLAPLRIEAVTESAAPP